MDHVALQARLQPHRPALHDLTSGKHWSYADLDLAIGKYAAVLRHDYGMNCGDRVAAVARNRAELTILHLACARAGLIFVPLNWRLSGAEIQALMADAEPALLLTDHSVAFAAQGVPQLGFDALTEQIQAATALPYEPIDKDSPSLILYTSGTSGRPKGVLLSERNLAQTAINFSILGRVNHRSVFLCDAPMFHVIGLISNFRPAFLCGASVLVSDGFDAARTLQRMSDPKLGVTHYFGVPQMAARLRQEPAYDPAALSGMTAIFTGGAPHPEADIRAWLNDGISTVDGFGMSEAGTVFGMPIEREMIAAKAGSVGVAPPGIEVRIVNLAGEDCDANEAGELWLRGENITRGYWRQPEATAAAFTFDGWLRTGDIAQRDEDGFYFLVDRKKDMYISGGENVYPAEVEAALAGMEGILEAAVVGVADNRWGEVGHLAVVCREGYNVDMAAVLTWLEPRLARYKLPKHLSIVSELPRTGSGKVLKHLLRQQLST